MLLSTRAILSICCQCFPFFPRHTTVQVKWAPEKIVVLHSMFGLLLLLTDCDNKRLFFLVHKEMGTESTRHTSLEEEGGKIFPHVVTKYFPPLYKIQVHMPHPLTLIYCCLFSTLTLAPFSVFFVIDLAFPSILLQAIKITLIEVMKNHTEKLFKDSENICLTFYSHILQQQPWMFSVRLGGEPAKYWASLTGCTVIFSYQQTQKYLIWCIHRSHLAQGSIKLVK